MYASAAPDQVLVQCTTIDRPSSDGDARDVGLLGRYPLAVLGEYDPLQRHSEPLPLLLREKMLHGASQEDAQPLDELQDGLLQTGAAAALSNIDVYDVAPEEGISSHVEELVFLRESFRFCIQ